MSEDDVQILNQADAHRGFMTLRKLRLRHRRFDGEWSAILDREVAMRGPACGVLPYDPARDAVALIRQFRPALHLATGAGWTWEAPGGGVAEGEEPAAAAVRELIEETGLNAKTLFSIGATAPSPAAFDEVVYLFVARVDIPREVVRAGASDEHEDIEMRRFSRAQALAMATDGRIVSAPTMVALMTLDRQRGRMFR